MSWSLHVRVLGVCGVWLALLTGCGGNPEVGGGNGSQGGNGAGGVGASSNAGTAGSLSIGGNTDPGAGGSDDEPTQFVCGNMVLEPGEFCDDGNTADGDGCSADCADVDPDYDCSAVGETCVKVVICGNGKLEGAELCDDMNLMAGDGCSADCGTVEDGWACIRPGTPCVEVSVCGNGVRERGEECDEGQAGPVGCDDQCQIVDGFYCPSPGAVCVQQVCGDGVRTPNEECDDAQMPPANGDGCSAVCAIEAGFHCNANGCRPLCGDGLVRGNEECDDQDRASGDGCSAACTEEPFFNCTGEPSTCVSSIKCNNGVVDPGEICEPPNVNGCSADCKSFDPAAEDPPDCGDGVIENPETCDPPAVGNGCTAACKTEAGYTCPQAGVCFKNPVCGDNVVQVATGEQCDPPKVGSGCSASCKQEAGWTCVGLGPSTCVKPVCNNGIVDPDEECDDKNNTNNDGCNSTCGIEVGWACPTAGAACIPKCGDGAKKGNEQCDDGNKTSGDGCNAGCKTEPGFKCPNVNMSCQASVCGDGTVDVGEGCDPKPGDVVAGDGCGPTCQPEPGVTVGPYPKVNVKCGDGLVTGTDKCDDGNDDNLDGCTDTCTVEDGWTCTGKTVLPTSLQMKVTYRDFWSAAASGGHPDFMYDDLGHVAGITGGVCDHTTGLLPLAMIDKVKCGHLDAQGKPELIKDAQRDGIPVGDYGTATGITSVDSFKLWYRDGNASNITGFNGIIKTSTINSTLTLTQDQNALYGGVSSEVYVYDAGGNNFYPINGQGLGNIGTEGIGCNNMGLKNYRDSVDLNNGACFCDGGGCWNRNYGFTTELRYFFQYKGAERLTFSGDDDVWVYVNGRLAVDIGGLHPQRNGQVVLGDDGNGVVAEDSNCSAHSTDVPPPDPGTPAVPLCLTTAERTDADDTRFDLKVGGVYEIALFHAERHVDASNFKLTLAGFLAPRSFCEPKCGDNKIVGDEVCDDGPPPNGNSDTLAGHCNTFCTARLYCGDGVEQVGEDCDNGKNIDLYKTAQSAPSVCAPGCKDPAFCGDNLLQAGQGEDCDKGNQNDNASYGPTSCTTMCKLGGYCGDGTAQTGNGEACDKGMMNGGYGADSCGFNCQPGKRCGDSIINDVSEKCDDGDKNGSPESDCTATCTKKLRCGDGEKNQATEECDYGQFASDVYGGCTAECKYGPSCGDGHPDAPYEECDFSTAGNTGGYDGCSPTCDLGPHCGDAVLQPGTDEACDNGFNDDDYQYDSMSCGPDCELPPYCGDGTKQAAFELCDDGPQNNDDTYNGCTTDCNFGPFCGDGTPDPQGGEVCDDGLDNVAYAPLEGGCGYDCQKAPWCGDGVRNGPEQCDMGTGQNAGEYGGCNEDCSFAPRCGDGKVDAAGGEVCDDGPTGSMSCTATCKRRVVVQ